MHLFSKEKELASLKQLFLLHEKSHKFLHASPLMPEVFGVDVYYAVLRSFWRACAA